MMPPIVPLILWASTLLAASSLLALTSNSTTLGTTAKHRVYNACTIIPNKTYYSNPEADKSSPEWHLFNECDLHHMNLQTSVSGTALKDNRCCRVCCNVTFTIGRYARHYLTDQKAPFGFPCGPDKICARDQACITKPNETIEIEEATVRRDNIIVNETSWYSDYS
uniref:Putative salivary secreted peptide n=1 Tax=Ixodes ricinus TaxID=34613 RepID=A0A6B0UX72_IXORI